MQAIHVAPLVDHAAAPDFADFVDAVGELVAAVLDMDPGRVPRQVAAVHVGDAGHRRTEDGKRRTDEVGQ